MSYIVGAYAAAPPPNTASSEVVAAFYDALAELPDVRGLELPCHDHPAATRDAWWSAKLRPEWDYVVTTIPGTMARLQPDPQFGLASTDGRGRAAALDFVRDVQQSVEQLNSSLGRAAVIGVELHSAPNQSQPGVQGSRDTLVESLTEISSWDWAGARLTIEHCDAFTLAHRVEKGFLSLGEEIAAVSAVNANTDANWGISINWGRSAVEARDAGVVAEHIAEARQAGVLAGLIFSGAADEDGPFGLAWEDTHLPPSDPARDHTGSVSLLTRAEIAKSLAATVNPSELDFLGFKVGVRPLDSTVDSRIAVIRDTMRILDEELRAVVA